MVQPQHGVLGAPLHLQGQLPAAGERCRHAASPRGWRSVALHRLCSLVNQTPPVCQPFFGIITSLRWPTNRWGLVNEGTHEI